MNLESRIKQWSKGQKIIAAIFTPVFSIIPAFLLVISTVIILAIIGFILTGVWYDRYEYSFYILLSAVYSIVITFYIEMKIFKHY